MIERIIIENYKSIRNLTLNLTPITILIGANGVGKSNFISFFELIHAIYNKQFGEYTLQHGGIDNLLYFGRKRSEFISGFIDFNNTNAFYVKIKPAQNNKGFLNEVVDYFNNHNFDKNYVQWHPQPLASNVEELELNKDKLREKHIDNYLNSFIVYHFHDTSQSSRMKQYCNVSDNRVLKHDGANLAAFLFYLQNHEPLSFKKIEASVRSIAPYFESFVLEPDKANPQTIQLEWREKNSDMYLNAYNLSDGTLRMIALTTLLLQPKLPNTILIDEPELGLHPFAINKLAGMLRQAAASGCQVIVSTQSVGLINNFMAEDIVVVDREEGQSVFHRKNSHDLQEWLDEYNMGDLWEKNLIGGQP